MPTIRDVAKAAGVCPSTVSHVLSNNRPVAQRTREHVLRTLREMKYHPSAVARGLSIKRMNTLGIVFAEGQASPIKDPYFSGILDGLISTARDHKQNTMLYMGEIGTPVEESVQIYCDGRSDGLILVAPRSDERVARAVAERGIPFVVVGDSCELPGVTTIDIDHVAAARCLIDFVLGQGHRRIAMLLGSFDSRCAYQREQGYREALAAHGIEYDEALVLPGTFTAEVADRIGHVMSLPERRRPTAIFCSNDFMALDAMANLQKMGYKVPQDVSVVGFDDIPLAAMSHPPLTTVRQPLHRMGSLAAERVLAQIEKREEAGEKIRLEVEIIVRESVSSLR